MGGRVGCWRVMAVAGLAGLPPTLLSLLHPGGRQTPRLAARPPVCLEAWVRLRSDRGCPVLAAAAGYRLEIHCLWGGHLERADGALVFAGPFSGRAFVSSRPVPLGRWVHLAGLAPMLAAPSGAPLPALPAAIAFDGRDVTAGRLTADAEPLPLGYDPWEERPSWVTAERAWLVAALVALVLLIPAAIALDSRDVTANPPARAGAPRPEALARRSPKTVRIPTAGAAAASLPSGKGPGICARRGSSPGSS
jgi:hypothetical protein